MSQKFLEVEVFVKYKVLLPENSSMNDWNKAMDKERGRDTSKLLKNLAENPGSIIEIAIEDVDIR